MEEQQQQQQQTASFGRVHVVVCGPPAGPPLLLRHGTTAPAPFMLCAPSLGPLLDRFRVYCPDLPCHAGSLSDPAVLDPSSHAHGHWCLEVARTRPGAWPWVCWSTGCFRWRRCCASHWPASLTGRTSAAH
ncbi:alpha beta hydrolase [Chlorella sorokiniana]|uniref:Alpha beta hydrolase n=1 Tax=Chlorella sorokiniana TaxID=3076 RepID=A0A2P6TJR3_CHLSO|nr:alpha beta hydrolase [Chlorella sorokiniana]|eukprot:PRW44324.1 alpha beta hydrolase [Chlorella sorokiniana]